MLISSLQTNASPLVEVRRLVKHFPIRSGVFSRVTARVHAVDDISFSIQTGKTLGLVGESGCGKSTVGRTVLGLTPPTSGEVYFQGRRIDTLGRRQMREVRRSMQVIFQDPYSSLNARMTVGDIVAEPLINFGLGNSTERRQRVSELLDQVGLPRDAIERFPSEFSGGQRQRIGIARALAPKPKVIICDEPVSALDVSVQAQVINLLNDLQEEFGISYLFVAHDLAVVEHISHRVGVMYLGKIVEIAEKHSLFSTPQHPYTEALISAVPFPDPAKASERIVLKGDVPSPLSPPTGCRFHTRCPYAFERCRVEEPALREVKPAHFAACHLRDDDLTTRGKDGTTSEGKHV